MTQTAHYALSTPLPNTDDQLSALSLKLSRPIQKNDIAIYGNGRWAIKGRDQFLFIAWIIDIAIVYVPSVVVYLLIASIHGAVSGVTIGFAALAMAGFSWAYGFACSYHRTLGGIVVGTRLVRLKDGMVLEFWRSGWVMFVRTALFPVLILMMGLGASSGGSPTVSNEREYHVSLDDAAMAKLLR